MTNPLIPFAFVPGMKAKASEVNENFSSLATAIDAYKASGTADMTTLAAELRASIGLKSDKTELLDVIITKASTDLNNYKTKGNYIFSDIVKPLNTPKADSGTLIVIGTEESKLTQFWFSNNQYRPIFTRTLVNNVWEMWTSLFGDFVYNPGAGYVRLNGGLLLQWGMSGSGIVTYPIAYTKEVVVVFSKTGQSESTTRSDTGFTQRFLTGHVITTSGAFSDHQWITIGV